MTNALVLYLQKPKLDPSSSKCSYYWVTIYISKIIHFAYNSFNYNTVSKRIIVGTALRRCPVSRGYTQRAEPSVLRVAATEINLIILFVTVSKSPCFQSGKAGISTTTN